MVNTVQLSIADRKYAASVREALSRCCSWQVESVERPDLSRPCALVLDEEAFMSLPLPLSNPERVVLITRKDPQLLAQAWDAGIVSVVSCEDPVNTVLLAIMAAALRVGKPHNPDLSSEISPSVQTSPALIPPHHQHSGSKRSKIQ